MPCRALDTAEEEDWCKAIANTHFADVIVSNGAIFRMKSYPQPFGVRCCAVLCALQYDGNKSMAILYCMFSECGSLCLWCICEWGKEEKE